MQLKVISNRCTRDRIQGYQQVVMMLILCVLDIIGIRMLTIVEKAVLQMPVKYSYNITYLKDNMQHHAF